MTGSELRHERRTLKLIGPTRADNGGSRCAEGLVLQHTPAGLRERMCRKETRQERFSLEAEGIPPAPGNRLCSGYQTRPHEAALAKGARSLGHGLRHGLTEQCSRSHVEVLRCDVARSAKAVRQGMILLSTRARRRQQYFAPPQEQTWRDLAQSKNSSLKHLGFP